MDAVPNEGNEEIVPAFTRAIVVVCEVGAISKTFGKLPAAPYPMFVTAEESAIGCPATRTLLAVIFPAVRSGSSVQEFEFALQVPLLQV